MTTTDYGNVVICRPDKQIIVRDEKDGEDRWCFTCRKHREFRFIVTTAEDWTNDYYGPTPSVICATCRTNDGDCFPGRYRAWGEE